MEVVLYRIDERLIHGQIMTAWQGRTGAKTVVIVDDTAAQDEFMIQIYRLAAPQLRVEVVDTAKFHEMAKDADTGRTIVLFKGPAEALKALEEKIVPDELIVGNVATAPGRKKYTKYAYLSDEEKGKLEKLQNLGWKVNMQLLPDDAKSRFER